MLRVVFAVGLDLDDGSKFAFGDKSGLPWPHLSQDMKLFKASTSGCVLVMGHKTWESLPCKLPNRLNVVVSTGRPVNKRGQFADKYITLDELPLESMSKHFNKDVAVIGGISLIESAIRVCDEVHVTAITPSDYQRRFDADVYAPKCVTELSPTFECVDVIEFSRLERETANKVTKIRRGIYKRRNVNKFD